MGVPSLFLSRAGRCNVSLYRGATPRSDRRTACAFRAHRTAGVEKYSPRGNVSLRGSRASDSACRCSCNFRLKTPQRCYTITTTQRRTVIYENSYRSGYAEGFLLAALSVRLKRALSCLIGREGKNTPRENLFVTLDTHQPNYMETNEGRHLPVPHCIEGTEGHALDNAIAAAVDGIPASRIIRKPTFGSVAPAGHAPRAAGTADGN